MKKSNLLLAVSILCVLGLSIVLLTRLFLQKKQVEEPILEGYYYSNTSANEIVLESPAPEERLSSPLTISGRARGTWFFEGDAPVILTDWDGLIIAQGYITAQDEWMTEEFVPFTGTLNFRKPEYGDRGSLILRADNPSDLPKYDRALEISIRFE